MYKKTIELFLMDGTPNDRIMCSISNWDGMCFKIPKTKVKNSKDRVELQSTGVYILLNKDEDNGIAYIGEAENIYERLLQHLSKKEFWTECLVFIKKGNNLNKAHIKYLENYLYNSAKNINRYFIENSSVPTKSSISESDVASMEEFAYYIKMLTSILGYKIFDELLNNNEYKEEEIFYINSIGLKAKGLLTNEGFVVLKGSESSDVFKTASSISLKERWKSLREKNIVNGENVFIEDKLFSSPSLAAAMILGRNANGLTEWKNKNKETLKQILMSN